MKPNPTRKPFRKPVGWVALVYVIVFTALCVLKLGDIPPGAVTVIMGFLGLVGTAICSSSYEEVRMPQRRDEETTESGGDRDVPHVP